MTNLPYNQATLIWYAPPLSYKCRGWPNVDMRTHRAMDAAQTCLVAVVSYQYLILNFSNAGVVDHIFLSVDLTSYDFETVITKRHFSFLT
jgi:hypothetical protein